MLHIPLHLHIRLWGVHRLDIKKNIIRVLCAHHIKNKKATLQNQVVVRRNRRKH